MIAEMPPVSQIGRKIRELRETKGWTLEDLAARVGISRSNLNKRELGMIRVRPNELQRYAEVFGIGLDELRRVATQDAIYSPPARGIPVLNRDEAGFVNDYKGADPMTLIPGIEYLERDPHTKDENLFALVVVGGSMDPEIREGDRVVLLPMAAGAAPELRSGESVVFAELAGTGKVRHVLARYFQRPDGNVELRPDNGKPMIVERGKIAKLSVVVQVRRNYR